MSAATVAEDTALLSVTLEAPSTSGGKVYHLIQISRGEDHLVQVGFGRKQSAYGGEGTIQYKPHAFDSTVAYWRRWIGRSTYRGRAREMVNRSALVLKLMTSEEFGSIVAAPTFRTATPPLSLACRSWSFSLS